MRLNILRVAFDRSAVPYTWSSGPWIRYHYHADIKDFMRQEAEVTYAEAHRRRRGEGVADFASKSDMLRAIERLDGHQLKGERVELVEDSSVRRSSSSSRGRSRSRSRSRQRDRRSRTRSRSRSRDGRKNTSDDRDTFAKSKDDRVQRAYASRSRSRSHSRQKRAPVDRDRDADDAVRRSRDRERDGRWPNEGDRNGIRD